MTENDFRVKYCELMEYYQYLEMRLKFICAASLADEEKGWFERLYDYDSDPFGLLLQKIKEYQKQKNNPMLSQDDFAALDEIRQKRNYWAHQCFGGLNPIVFNRGQLRRAEYGNLLISDLNEAIEWDKQLTEMSSNNDIEFK